MNRNICSSDRYKIYVDLFNLASFIIPREFIPKLNNEIRSRLSTASVSGIFDEQRNDQISENNAT